MRSRPRPATRASCTARRWRGACAPPSTWPNPPATFPPRTASTSWRRSQLYGPIPPLTASRAENLFARLVHDKKTVQGKVHFVLPVRIGEVTVVSGIDEKLVLDAIRSALA